jgi:hypothetical protein
MKISKVIPLLITAFFAAALSGCTTRAADTLNLEEYQLTGKPQLTPLTFQPVQGTQSEILAKNAGERAKVILNPVTTTVDGNPAMSSLGESMDMQAIVLTAAIGQPEQTVQLKRGTEVIFEAPAGLPSPVVPVQALWTYDGHWALEILYSDATTWAGKIYIDGKLVNDQKGYNEAFGLQLLADKPFFFYKRDGKEGYSYDGKETDLNFDEIPHYNCCEEGEFNPIQAQNMVAFFAQRASSWYYVELGVFK